MNRDMDAVRKIVLALQEADKPLSSLAGVPDDVFKYNANLAIEAGLAHGNVSKYMELNGVPGAVTLERLTWEGHDFADSIRDDTVWRKAKDKVLKPTASWSFAILKEYLKHEIRQGLGMGGDS